MRGGARCGSTRRGGSGIYSASRRCSCSAGGEGETPSYREQEEGRRPGAATLPCVGSTPDYTSLRVQRRETARHLTMPSVIPSRLTDKPAPRLANGPAAWQVSAFRSATMPIFEFAGERPEFPADG